MVQLRILALLLFGALSLFATVIPRDEVIENRYSIKLGVFKTAQSIERIKKIFADRQIVIVPFHGKNHIYLTNFETKQAAETFLRQAVRKRFHDAFTLQNRSRTRKPKATKMVMTPKAQKIRAPQIKQRPVPEQNITADLNLPTPYPVAVTDRISAKTPQPTDQNISTKQPIKSVIDRNETQTDANATLTLHEAVKIALGRSRKLLSQREKVIQQKWKVEEKRGAFLPNVNLYATAGYNYTHTRADSDSEDKYPAGDTQLSITENLYAGGKQKAELEREKRRLAVEAATFRDKVEEETMKIIKAYLDLYYQQKAIEIERKNMQKLQKIESITEIKTQNGAASKGDLSNIKSKVENARTALVKATARYQSAKAFYEYFLGKEAAQRSPSEGLFTFPKHDHEAIFRLYLQHNAKVVANRNKIEAQKFDYRAKKAAFRPTIDLIVTGKEKFSKAEIDPYRDEKASAVLSMNYNLYKGGRDKAKLMQSKSRITQLSYQYEDIVESIRYNLKQLIENIGASNETLVHIQKEVEENEKAVESYWNAFGYATVDIQTLLLAQRALNSARQSLIKEQKNFVLSHFKLLQQTGELLPFLKIDDFVDPDKM